MEFCKISLALIPGVIHWVSALQELVYTIKFIRERRQSRKQHNCVVTYTPYVGMMGWIDTWRIVQHSMTTLEDMSVPLIEFVKSAKYTLDIAVMSISISSVFHCLTQKLKEGVRIRIIVDSSLMASSLNLFNLEQAGAEVQYYIMEDSMMHFKYAIKDAEFGRGYIVLGSMNWTSTSIMKNFDDLIFTSNQTVVKTFHENFKQMWNYVHSTYDVSACRAKLQIIKDNLRNYRSP